MKKFWQLVSKKDFYFILAIFVIVIILSVFESYNKVAVEFGTEAVDIKASKYSMNIPYELVDSIELADMPDRGEQISGRDNMTVRTGIWKNEAWGEHYICADLAASKCIVVHLNDGRTFVFSRRNNEETTNIFGTLRTYLPDAAE